MSDGSMSVGLFFPITTSEAAIPPLDGQRELAAFAESLGFDALWVRDVPLFSPSFGDAGQVYDPWVFLAQIAERTDSIALATGSIVLPLRHPWHVAKSAASLDQLSDGRLVLGVASGDRPEEFPAFDVPQDRAGARFREHVGVLRDVWTEEFPVVESSVGDLDGSLDLLPKPTTDTIPLLVTGFAQQSLDWIAEHGDGWVFYQRDLDQLADLLEQWRGLTDGAKPFVQVMHIDLAEDPSAGPRPIHQGYAAGIDWIADRFEDLSAAGVDHVMINVRHGERDVREVLEEFAEAVLT